MAMKRANSSSTDASGSSSGDAKKQKLATFPAAFQELEKIHFRLNSYFTFLSSRKHVITTFEMMKSSAEAAISRPLELIDIAKLCYLLPNDIVFEYCDENQFLVEEKKFTYRKGFEQRDGDIFELKDDAKQEESRAKQLLVFEFVDGNLKKSKTKLYHKTELRLPVYTPESMKALIKRRDDKFFEALTGFLDNCNQIGVENPMDELTKLAEPLVPKPKEFLDPIEEMVKNGDRNRLQAQNLHRPTIPAFVDTLRASNFYKGQIVENGEFVIEPKRAVFDDLTFPLSEQIWHALEASKKIVNFYSHQAQALNAIHNGQNVIISTSTSSGKSLIYQVPVVKSLEDDRNDITTMYIFPTKALAQDQKRSLTDLLAHFPDLKDVVVETFDGDTDKTKRDYVKRNAKVIFTNPDMLHTSILPSHTTWRAFLSRLKYVVIDELHMYKGLFGSHVALIMRRLRRICSWLGNHGLQFISCSATLKNPTQHMSNIFGVADVVHIDEDGSPSGEKHLVVWNPPYLNPKDPANGRESHIIEAAKILVEMVLKNIRTISFCVVRKACEMLMKEVRIRLEKIGRPELISQVMSYRGGYSMHDRRKIEKEMFSGNLKAIISTNALELGIDIGVLDAVLICGFPITMANFHQQSGRAGRRNKDSLTLIVGGNNPADQYYMKRPELLMQTEFQDLVLDFDNLLVLEAHIQCAAFEMPLFDLEQESNWFGDLKKIKRVCEERLLYDPSDGSYHVHNRFLPWPANHVSIRAIEEDTYAVVDVTNGRNVVIEEVEASRTSFTLYDGGIFIHQGYPYLVREFNADEKFAKVERTSVEWTTNQRDFTDVDPKEIELIRSLRGKSDVPIYFGKIETTIIVFGFFKVDQQKRILDAVEVYNPPVIIKSKGLWIDIPKKAIELIKFKKLSPAAGIHAAQHAIISLLPLFIVSGTDEIHTECKAPEKEFATRQTKRKRPARLIFYDSKGGQWGSGLSTKAFEHIDEILEDSLKRVVECPCDWGCPDCVAASFCKENSLVLSKPAAIIILSTILAKELDLDSVLNGPEPNMPELHVETIEAVNTPVKFSPDVEIINVKKAENALTEYPKEEIVELKQSDDLPDTEVKLELEDDIDDDIDDKLRRQDL